MNNLNWVLKCIDSCNNQFQLECAKTLAGLYIMKYPELATHKAIIESALLEKDSRLMIAA